MSKKEKYPLLPIRQLAFRFDLHRDTVKTRLDKAGIEPVAERANEKLYELTPEVEEIIAANTDNFDEAKLRKIKAEADEKELKVLEKKGELVSTAEVKEAIQKIFSKMHRELAVQLPKKLSARIKKAKDAGEVQQILSAEVGRVFDQLRTDHTKFL